MPARDRADVVRRARALLGRTITGHGVTVRITEVEAYGGMEDPASHAFTRTPRSEVMYGPAYRLYVYRSYGIHFCANVVTGPTEIGAAVLLRSGEVVDGHDLARLRRGIEGRDVQLARGPGNLAQALGITLDDLGTDLLADHPDGDLLWKAERREKLWRGSTATEAGIVTGGVLAVESPLGVRVMDPRRRVPLWTDPEARLVGLGRQLVTLSGGALVGTEAPTGLEIWREPVELAEGARLVVVGGELFALEPGSIAHLGS